MMVINSGNAGPDTTNVQYQCQVYRVLAFSLASIQKIYLSEILVNFKFHYLRG